MVRGQGKGLFAATHEVPRELSGARFMARLITARVATCTAVGRQICGSFDNSWQLAFTPGELCVPPSMAPTDHYGAGGEVRVKTKRATTGAAQRI